MSVRTAETDEALAVLRVLEGALLDVDPDRVRDAVAAGHVLVAGDDRVRGALVAAPGRRTEIVAVAVRRAHRRQGLGTELVKAAAARWGPLVADCRPELRAFYEECEFSVVERAGRLYGVR